jgi:hypothetical protein
MAGKLGSIVVFRILKRTDSTRTSRFGKLLYGYTDWSNKSRYSYERPGLLGTIPHRKLIRGVIIVETEDVSKVISFLGKYGAEYYVRTVVLDPEDEMAFKRKAQSER